jgi:hypothetical protein
MKEKQLGGEEGRSGIAPPIYFWGRRDRDIEEMEIHKILF